MHGDEFTCVLSPASTPTALERVCFPEWTRLTLERNG